MRIPTKKEILKNDVEIERMLEEPSAIIWSVIEELKDIEGDFAEANKESHKHLLHQIDRLETVLEKLGK